MTSTFALNLLDYCHEVDIEITFRIIYAKQNSQFVRHTEASIISIFGPQLCKLKSLVVYWKLPRGYLLRWGEQCCWLIWICRDGNNENGAWERGISVYHFRNWFHSVCFIWRSPFKDTDITSHLTVKADNLVLTMWLIECQLV